MIFFCEGGLAPSSTPTRPLTGILNTRLPVPSALAPTRWKILDPPLVSTVNLFRVWKCVLGEARCDAIRRTTSSNTRGLKTTSTTNRCRPTANWSCRRTTARWATCRISTTISSISSSCSISASSRRRPLISAGSTWRRSSALRPPTTTPVLATPSAAAATDTSQHPSTTPPASPALPGDPPSVPRICTRAHDFSNWKTTLVSYTSSCIYVLYKLSYRVAHKKWTISFRCLQFVYCTAHILKISITYLQYPKH